MIQSLTVQLLMLVVYTYNGRLRECFDFDPQDPRTRSLRISRHEHQTVSYTNNNIHKARLANAAALTITCHLTWNSLAAHLRCAVDVSSHLSNIASKVTVVSVVTSGLGIVCILV